MNKLFIYLFYFSVISAQSFQVSGLVLDNQNKLPISDVNIVSSENGASTDNYGKFSFIALKDDSISFSHIGYKPIRLKISENMNVFLQPVSLIGNSVDVSAYRAISGLTPVSFSTLTQNEISLKYTAQDIPMVLASEPGVWSYSESGNGTGYSYLSIRGFDQSRIAVLLDGVPLNDNESHQVYWVDHGDLLADTKDIQIQRGIGTSLYGSSSFGGSINVRTHIQSEDRNIEFSQGLGSYNTLKTRLKYQSGRDLGENTSIALRASSIDSDGYRKFHGSAQKGMFFGLEHRGSIIKNQFRMLIGYENTQLSWDGVSGFISGEKQSDIDDRTKRRNSFKAYTDDFLQQIYSLNSSAKIGNKISFRNVTYLVKGRGYYEIFKSSQDFYSYNLDINNIMSDEVEKSKNSDLLRRKWIDNSYYGFIPMITISDMDYRLDFGGEVRFYSGDHFGEVSQFSDPSLSAMFNDDWYRYYQYTGNKNILTAFTRLIWSPSNQPFAVSIDLQNQNINWGLNQKKIGHAAGHQLTANWNFFNPRIGLVWEISDSLSWFVNTGKAQKEPADNQIIVADDMFSAPVMAANEVVSDIELGMNFTFNNGYAKINGYRMLYLNEQLKSINLSQEGEYSYYAADSTTHSGFEYESKLFIDSKTILGINGAIQMNVFNNGNFIPNTPSSMMNVSLSRNFSDNLLLSAHYRKIGGMYIDNYNSEDGYINSYGVFDLGAHISWKKVKVSLKINNTLNKLYSTYGYSFDYNGYNAFYWPGAECNTFINISYRI